MAVYTAQFTIWPTSNLQADASVNTWSCDASSAAAAEDFADAVIVLYQALDEFFPNTVRQNSHTVKIYRQADPEPRVPVAELTWNFPAVPSGISLPPEVAKCLSFQGDPASGINQARRRGRVFLGPLNTGSQATTGPSAGRPSGSFLTAVSAAADALLDTSDLATDWYWGVYSPTSDAIVEVTNGWVDDEWDTQRSRGRVATARVSFP